MSNYTILQQNVLAGLSETAGALYLSLCDRFEAHKSSINERRAFMTACAYDGRVGATLEFILSEYYGKMLTSHVRSELSEFFAKRWQHNYMEDAKC